MRWDFHGIIVDGGSNHPELAASWGRSFASRPGSGQRGDICCRLDVVEEVPAFPPGSPQFSQGNLLHYYVEGNIIIAHFPNYGQLRLDLNAGTTAGLCTITALTSYGVLEDLIAISLSPHLRRRGMFLIHAFAASRQGQGILLVGGIGAGKTTSGMALLDAGWKLLSNDSPILGGKGQVLSYPGVLAAYPETFARFASTEQWAGEMPAQSGRAKLTIPAETIWPTIWADRAPLKAIFFPQIEKRPDHAIEPLSPAETLRRLLPHAIEQWDREMIPSHLRLLRQLSEQAKGYVLRLGPEVPAIPPLLESVLG